MANVVRSLRCVVVVEVTGMGWMFKNVVLSVGCDVGMAGVGLCSLGKN